MQFTTIRPRKRRHVLNDTSVSITIHDVRREIMRQFEQLMPLKYCKSSEKVCPAGNLVLRALFPPKPGKSSLGTRLSCRPPGLPDPTGAKGPRGRRGPRGKKGSQGPMGPPGKSGKTGTRREKRAQGEPGPKGMPGPPGRPGKSISAQQIMLSPAEKTRDEGGNTAFYCTVEEIHPLPSNDDSKVESFFQMQSIWLKKERWLLRIWITAMLGSTHVPPETFLGRLRPLVTCQLEVRGILTSCCLVMISDAFNGDKEG